MLLLVHRVIRQTIVRVVVLLLAVPLTLVAQASQVGGLAFRAVRADRDTIALIGSVHVLDTTNANTAQSYASAVKAARLVYFELDIDSAAKDMPTAIRMGLVPAGLSLWKTLSPNTDSLVRAFLPRLGAQPDQVTPLKPWLLALQITGAANQVAGLQPKLGVDQQLWSATKAASRPTAGLETAGEQLAIFDRMSPADQETLLRNAIIQFDSAGLQARALMAAWRSRDDATFDRLTNGRLERYPAAKRAMIDDRNERWLQTLDRAASARQGVFAVVVGAAHLTGPSGLVAKLRALGYTVSPL